MKPFNGKPPPDPWHTITLINGYTVGPDAPRYRIDAVGTVRFQGRVNQGSAGADAVMFNLDLDYRPTAPVDLPVVTFPRASTTGFIRVATNGQVTAFLGMGTPTAWALDNVTFSTY